MPTKPELRLKQAMPESIVVGAGQYLLISGEVNTTQSPLIELEIDPVRQRDCKIEVFPGKTEACFEFTISILWRADDIGQRFSLTVKLLNQAGEICRYDLGEIELLANAEIAVASAHRMGDQPLIAICMATYNPDIGRLSRQIESILCQSYGNWLLIISDDASEQANWHEIEALCRLDPRRIRFYHHQKNLGFYRNFERALNYLPENAQLVALADQDDIWYPEKLQVLVDELLPDPAVLLVYSDMRVVNDKGDVKATSYWKNRRNEYRDLATVLVANTVTGAACLFKRELLDSALPFPQPIGDVYHDHWLACTALSAGELRYVSAPLYDYVQYADSVLGHCDYAQAPLSKRLGHSLGKESRLEKAYKSRHWQAVYRRDCLRLQVMAKTLHIRIASRASAKAMRLMAGDWLSGFRLIKIYLLNRLKGRTTNSAELWLAIGFIRGKGNKKSCNSVS